MLSDVNELQSLQPGTESESELIPHANSLFKQQKVSACKPFLTPLMASVIYGVFSVISLIIGVTILTSSDTLFEKVIDYSQCPNNRCNITFDRDIIGPLYFYYQLRGFYQNHQAYIRSKAFKQFQGQMPSNLESCSPVLYNPYNADKKTIVPCGSVPFSIFNDTFSFDQSESKNYTVKESGISQPSLHSIFRPINEGYLNSQYDTWISSMNNNMTNEHFVNWVQIAPFGTFRKLYAVIENHGIKKGDSFVFDIVNNYPDLDGKSFKKQIVIGQVDFLGGKNKFFGIFYVVLCSFSALASIVFLVLHILKVLPLYKSKTVTNVMHLSLIP